MIVEELDANAEPGGNSDVDAHPGAARHHLRAWQLVVKRECCLRAPFLFKARPENQLLGLLPLSCVPSSLGEPWTNAQVRSSVRQRRRLFESWADALGPVASFLWIT